ncbi:T9SS type B sorting domain-containing protein [Kriegella aquimaris]|uniref:Gliding motility-associated C-terminal domain-containing protein n=1 Tax=Kriegella aquimaris TaxID=192904 RepID=A0A1G9JUA8_9FLAO|nr:T9SS type B sorting domain-containing protein [Kriegella aquimaris]SDL41109.1 gliding motility-associated C-terminal domain-containing protein [Kriegella aquimaris]
MLPKKTRHILYAVLLLMFSAICTSAIANPRVFDILEEITSVLDMETPYAEEEGVTEKSSDSFLSKSAVSNSQKSEAAMSASMFATIIEDADDIVNCTNNGFMVARFILCGDSDDRNITLSGSPYGSVSWEQLTGAPADTNLECPNTNNAHYTQVSIDQSFDLDASTISPTLGAEFRVRVNDSGAYYYFEVVKSTINQTYTKKDFICNNPGRIELTGLPNNYQFRIREGLNGFSPYQSSSIFPNLDPGFYTVQARLNIDGQVCEYLYDVIEVRQVDIEIDVTFTNPVCSGETGSIDVAVNPEVPGPYVYTLLDEFGAEIEFTSTISSNTHTFSTVSEGTYAVKVETNECKEDIPNGIAAPIQYSDTSGNPIAIGTGLSPITVTSDTNGMSFGCPPSSGVETVGIDISATGGSGTYSYTVSDGGNSGGTFTGTSTYNVTASGTYTFYITDDQGCTAEKSEYVALLDPPDITASSILGTCTNGGGKVEFTVIDPKGFNLEYRATNNAADPWTSSQIIPVADDTYNIIEVQYSQGGFTCVLALPPVTVTSEGGLIASASLTQDYTCANGGAIIDFAPTTGGSGSGYEYSVDNVNYQSGTNFPSLPPGTYIPYVRDDANCYQALAPITVNEPDPPSAIDFVQDNLDCAAGTSRVTINVTSTVAIAQYEVVSPGPTITQAGNVFNGLILDTPYQFEITDANGCVYPASFTTGGLSSIRAQVKSGGDRKVCPSVADGNGAFLIDGFDIDTPGSDYNYTVNRTTPPPASTTTVFTSGTSSDLEIPISGLGAGTYEITVTDTDTNCTSTASFDVVEAATALSVTPDVTLMSCQNGNVGRVQATANGGFGGYNYRLEWPAPSTTVQGPKSGRTFGNLTAEGEYILTVIDSEGCEAETRFTLTALQAPSISLVSASYCYDPIATPTPEYGAITVSSSGGGAGHQYRINSGSLQASPTFNGLVPGTYTVEVVDVNNCSAELLPITIPPQIQVTLDIANEIPCGGDGEMDITVTGGDISNLAATSYTIEYRDVAPNAFAAVPGYSGVTLPSGSFSYTVPYGEHGDYRVSVTDINGCTSTSEPITFSEPTNIMATHRIEGPSCGDPNSGFVEIIPTVSSGVPPFQVVFAPVGELRSNPLDPNISPDPTPGAIYSYSSQTIYSGLAAGDYEYVVKDDRNCVTAVIPITVAADPLGPPDATVTPINATCGSGSLSGGVTINTITAGSPDYTVIIEDNFGNQYLSQSGVAPGDSIIDPSLVPGDYQIIIMDSRGCRDIEPITINSTTLDIVPTFPPPPVVCTPSGTTICVDIIGGTLPLDYDIRLTDPNPVIGWEAPNNTPSNHCFNGLLFGVSYTVDVRDNNTGCIYSEVITLPDGPGPGVTLDVDGATCRNGDIGLNYTISSGTGPYDVVITNLDTGAEVFNVTGSFDTTLASDITAPSGHYGIAVTESTGCTAGDEDEAILNAPRVDIIDNQNANCNELGQLTVRGSGGTPFATGSPYLYAYVPAGNPVDNDGTLTPLDPSDDFSDASTVALPGALAPGIDYDIWVKDFNDCAYRISAAVVQLNPDLPAPTISVNNQCDVTTPVGGFTITLEMGGDIDTPTFTLNGISQTPAYIPGTPTQATFTVNSIGSYPVNVIDANGCDVDAVAEVYQVLSASGDYTTEPTCEASDGIITINADGGSGDFTYVLTGNDFLGSPINITDPNNDGIFENIPPGDYQVEITDNLVDDGVNNCTALVDDIIRERPIQPVIDDVGATDITCNGSGDGSINVSLVVDADPNLNPNIKEYNLYSGTLPLPPSPTPIATNASGSFQNLGFGTYVVEVVTDRNCTDVAEVDIDEPPVFEIDAISGTLVCEPGANRFSTTTVSAVVTSLGNGTPNGYKINLSDSYQSSPDFLIVDTGFDQVITIYAIDSKGCEFSDSVTVLAPTAVTATITQLSAMNCEDPERIRIDVVGSTDFTIEDQGSSTAFVADQVVSGASFVEFDLPMVAGEYRLQINDNGGCTYPIEAYFVVDPVLPTITISESKPVSCFGVSDSALSINVTNYTGAYHYDVYYANDPGFSGGAFGTVLGSGDLNTSTNPETISGLPGGNLRVVVKEIGNPKCEAFSNLINIRTPSEQLLIASMAEVGRVGCSDDLGEITVAAEGGWDASGYEFMLEYENPVGSGFSPHATYGTFAANGANDRFTGLSSGNYRVTVRDIEGCTTDMELELMVVPPIEAEAIITRELECPQGSDAVIVAVEPGTSTPGAFGGVPGAGYQYRLLRLNSNDNTDIASSTGYQANPDFVGASGTGVISGGWYAIEVVSSSNCSAVTTPLRVIPPPPISPALIQTSVPACGNIATMKIKVNNPQGGIYEYREYNNPADPWKPIDEIDLVDGNPVKMGIPGIIGSSYRFEIQKVGSLSSCMARSTNGITITDADPLTLDPTSPTFDISCAYEVDGRIEAIANGGTGIYEFRIYDTDPGSDAFAAELLPTYNGRGVQDYGTFENLDPGDYWISVISRQNCGIVEGPFSIAPAEPVIIVPSSSDVTCNGADDGEITMTVTSPTTGLVQFAIGPNLNEFFSDPANPNVFTFRELPAKPVGEFYTVLAQDAEGCPQIFQVPVHEPESVLVANLETTPELCIDASDGTVSFNVTGGTRFNDVSVSPTPYYEYKIEMIAPVNETGTGVFAPYDGQPIGNLQGGASYALYIQDVNLCATTEVFTIGMGVDLMAEPIVQYGCEGIFPNSTTTVEMQDNSVLPQLLFSLDIDDINVADTQRVWGDLLPGDHTVYIYHENGCVNNVSFTIDSYDPLTLTAIKTAANELTATADGGFGGYEFFFQGESTGTENVFTTNESTTVTVEVRDQNGCVASVTIPFEFTGMLEIPNFFTPDGDNNNDVWFPGNRDLFPDIEVKIYDRYGRVVAELDQVTNWDGTYDGNNVPTGDYWYVVNANDKSKLRYVGHFTLYR